MSEDFEFIDNVPSAIRPVIHDRIAAWIRRADTPVFGITLDGHEIDFCRRPWPPQSGVVTTVGAERLIDTDHMEEYLASGGKVISVWDL